ncbi:MAG: hypothetical protein M3Q45_11940, partial [Chloroflexota bacterium]|nr:hypothetical protein [Chloroflexota bacterium]
MTNDQRSSLVVRHSSFVNPMRFLFVSAQLPGHLDWGGYLATAVALQQGGHNVLWVSGQAVASLVSQAGVPIQVVTETGWRWPPPPPRQPTADETPEAWQRIRTERALDQWLDQERVEQACTELIEIGRAYQPHVIVSEMFVSAAGIAAEVLATPLVVAGWPAMQPKAVAGNQLLSNLARERLNRLCARFHIHGINWTADGPPALLSPLLHLTYWHPRWYTGVTLLAQTHHVGGIAAKSRHPLPAWATTHPPDAKPWVLVTLGTSFG